MKIYGNVLAFVLGAVAAPVVLLFTDAWEPTQAKRIKESTARFEAATKASEGLKAAQAMQLESLKALERQRAAEEAARKAGDAAMIARAQEAILRAEAEAARRQEELVKQREAAAQAARAAAMKAKAAADKAAKSVQEKEPTPPTVAVDPVVQARRLEADGKFSEAVRLYRRAARDGNCPAARRLGEIYEYGMPGVNRDSAESRHWYDMARQCGEKVPTSRVTPVPSEPSPATVPMKARPRTALRAPEPVTRPTGSSDVLPMSRAELAEVEADARRPELAGKTAAELFAMASALEAEGKDAEAVRMYRRAGRMGSGPAAKRLGEVYDKGQLGAKRDLAESLQWYEMGRLRGEIVPTAKGR